MAIEQSTRLPGSQGTPRGGARQQNQQQQGRVQGLDPIPQLFNGATFAAPVNIPSSVIAGQSFTITGVMGFDCPICAFDRPVRVVAEITNGQTRERVSDVARLSGRGETSQFAIEVPTPQQAGQSLTVRLKAQHKESGEWATNNTRGPFTVNVVTQTQKAADQALGAAPWVVGGAGIGAGTALATDRDLLLPATAIGTGVGASAYAVSSADVLPRITFPTEEVLAVSLLLGTGGFLLSQFGLDEIAGAVEEATQGIA